MAGGSFCFFLDRIIFCVCFRNTHTRVFFQGEFQAVQHFCHVMARNVI